MLSLSASSTRTRGMSAMGKLAPAKSLTSAIDCSNSASSAPDVSWPRATSIARSLLTSFSAEARPSTCNSRAARAAVRAS